MHTVILVPRQREIRREKTKDRHARGRGDMAMGCGCTEAQSGTWSTDNNTSVTQPTEERESKERRARSGHAEKESAIHDVLYRKTERE